MIHITNGTLQNITVDISVLADKTDYCHHIHDATIKLALHGARIGVNHVTQSDCVA